VRKTFCITGVEGGPETISVALELERSSQAAYRVREGPAGKNIFYVGKIIFITSACRGREGPAGKNIVMWEKYFSFGKNIFYVGKTFFISSAYRVREGPAGGKRREEKEIKVKFVKINGKINL